MHDHIRKEDYPPARVSLRGRQQLANSDSVTKFLRGVAYSRVVEIDGYAIEEGGRIHA